MISVTPQAAAQIRVAARESGAEDLGLRVAAQRLSDGSVNYGMGFDGERDNDEMVESEGVTLLVAPQSRELLDTVTIDYVELEPGDFRFIFINPAEQGGDSSCGSKPEPKPCGSGCG